MAELKKTYLGGGLYADFDGLQLRLWAEHNGKTHEVYLEPDVYDSLVQWMDYNRGASNNDG